MIQRYAYDFETFVLVLSVSFYQVWHFTATRTTPACPEVDEYHFTFTYIVRQFHGLSVRSFHFEICELLAYGSCFHLFYVSFDFDDYFIIRKFSRDLRHQRIQFVYFKIVVVILQQMNAYEVCNILSDTCLGDFH